MMRGLAGVVLAALTVLTFAVGTVSAAETHRIPIAQYAYVPATMTVHVGDVVTWTNQDQAAHDVAGGTFRSPMLAQGQSWSFTFTQPGTYDYICSVHPDMRAQIVVVPVQTHEPTAAPPPAQPVVQEPAATTTTSQPPVTTTTTSTDVVVAAPEPKSPALPPMLLLAGLVAAVTTLCLLMIGSRPDRAGSGSAAAEVGEGTEPA